MARLGTLSQSWASAAASLPTGWQISPLWRFGDLWIALAEGSGSDNYLSGSGPHGYQALQRLADRLRERHRVASG